ncbi:MAG: bifunctional UDP-N-acetylmuramoyl-tripeptide:D-alanyl-D-alanine ligase/alanine racemase [Bacteroidetes bacterium]|nr:MAG: bifunctional UDP-N-acetylmuramoyl-tripeptide:D-alanyl-D-alanine ligase/alanine racemase [Bacteroidota bacterium]
MYSILKIADALNWHFANPSPFEYSIARLLLDSRQVIFPRQSLFFALKGKRHDGHEFIADTYAAGVRNFVVSQPVETSRFPDANFIIVPDVVTALQDLARFHRQHFDLKIIGITGSNGKTVVKEWLFQLLQKDFKIVRSPKSYNSQIGVPLSVWQIGAEHDLGLFEAGISQPGEMEKSAGVLQCDMGIFTNIGPAHDEGFRSRSAKIREKLKLFEPAKTIIFARNDDAIDEAMGDLSGKSFFTWTWQKNKKDADLRVEAPQKQDGHTTLKATFRQKPVSITIPFTDSASIENAIHCWATLLFLGLKPAVIRQRMALLEPVAMRLELKSGINRCLVINDSYNSDLTSLTIALNFLDQQSTHLRRTVILSDMLQTGQPPEVLYRFIAQLLNEKGIRRVIGIGGEVPLLKSGLAPECSAVFYPNTSDFLARFNPDEFQNETILLKGARKFEFERIANRLHKKAHQTTLEVDLGALIHNLSVFKSFLKPKTKIMAMVKASAYGSGSVEVAKLLEFHNVNYLGVAYADEGVELRQAGIRLPIFVMNPEEATFETLIRYRLEPEMYSLRLLRKFSEFTQIENARARIHLKFDTGMHRLGFEAPDLPAVFDLLKNNPQLTVASMMSHLAASDESRHDAFTLAQIERFERLSAKTTQQIGYQPLRHILNSSGIARFSAHQMDMVRLGIGLYGVDSSEEIQNQLRVVLTLKATISQIKTVGKDETVGYGRHGKIDRPRRIATISVGYADGLLRGAGNGRFEVYVRGKAAPIVGNVCMDMSMIDVSHIPEAEEGDEVVVFGQKPTVGDLARQLNTIPYEIFTGISRRVKRVYFQE